jgi:hypothetical protein
MQTHLEDRLPLEYQNCMAGINQVLKMSWDIATRGSSDSLDNNSNTDNSKSISSTMVDDRTRLQALALANDCYKYKMDLVTNGVVISDAIKFVQQKKEELEKVSGVNSTKCEQQAIVGKNSQNTNKVHDHILRADKTNNEIF